MTQEFVQVRPDNGYLIHAVSANAESIFTGLSTERWSKQGPICRKIQTRDAQRLPNLSFQFDAKCEKKPFDKAFILSDDAPAFCKKCSQRVLWATEH